MVLNHLLTVLTGMILQDNHYLMMHLHASPMKDGDFPASHGQVYWRVHPLKPPLAAKIWTNFFSWQTASSSGLEVPAQKTGDETQPTKDSSVLGMFFCGINQKVMKDWKCVYIIYMTCICIQIYMQISHEIHAWVYIEMCLHLVDVYGKCRHR